MNLKSLILLLQTGLLILTQSISGQINPERQWPGYRGYFASGVLDYAGLPSEFDIEKSVNIRWKIPVPGLGISSPVIWGDRLFITTAVSEQDKAGFKPGLYGDVTPVKDESVHSWKVYCIDKNNGRIIWEKLLAQEYRQLPMERCFSGLRSTLLRLERSETTQYGAA